MSDRGYCIIYSTHTVYLRIVIAAREAVEVVARVGGRIDGQVEEGGDALTTLLGDDGEVGDKTTVGVVDLDRSARQRHRRQHGEQLQQLRHVDRGVQTRLSMANRI